VTAHSSELPGFHNLTRSERLRLVQEFAQLTDDEARPLLQEGSLPFDLANRMIENVIATMSVPLGVATNFRINGRDYLVPMAIEEASVVAAASNAAKMARAQGGFTVTNTGPVMIGQIQVVHLPNPDRARRELLAAKSELLAKANEQDPLLVSVGGGAQDMDVKVLQSLTGPMVIAELFVDCRDAMGANSVNTMAEALAPLVERITGGQVLLRIISNLATRRLVRATALFTPEAMGGADVVEGVLHAYAFAAADPYRCATHNKGVMNGVTAVALATGQDTRALEAGAHAYAARTGRYSPLTVWERTDDGGLQGTLEMPMAVGLIGGATKVHPVAKLAVRILGVQTAMELAEVMGAVGLAQNFAALRALAAEGIQRGHMKLHARNVAVSAGATGEWIDVVARRMVEERKVRMDRAKEILEELMRRAR
jgi:hydroxymethylglutaryl-CoA reductase